MSLSNSSLGFSEIGVYYPMLAEQVPVFEAVASEVMPRLRKSFAPGG